MACQWMVHQGLDPDGVSELLSWQSPVSSAGEPPAVLLLQGQGDLQSLHSAGGARYSGAGSRDPAGAALSRDGGSWGPAGGHSAARQSPGILRGPHWAWVQGLWTLLVLHRTAKGGPDGLRVSWEAPGMG